MAIGAPLVVMLNQAIDFQEFDRRFEAIKCLFQRVEPLSRQESNLVTRQLTESVIELARLLEGPPLGAQWTAGTGAMLDRYRRLASVLNEVFRERPLSELYTTQKELQKVLGKSIAAFSEYFEARLSEIRRLAKKEPLTSSEKQAEAIIGLANLLEGPNLGAQIITGPGGSGSALQYFNELSALIPLDWVNPVWMPGVEALGRVLEKSLETKPGCAYLDRPFPARRRRAALGRRSHPR
jgi:hypothetical protein